MENTRLAVLLFPQCLSLKIVHLPNVSSAQQAELIALTEPVSLT